MPESGLVISKMQDVVVVTFRATSILDDGTVESIRQDLYSLVDEQARRKVLLDFGHVRFLTSAMLGVLIALHKKSQAIKGKLVICGLRPDLKKIFAITKLDSILEFADDEADALKRFGVHLEN